MYAAGAYNGFPIVLVQKPYTPMENFEQIEPIVAYDEQKHIQEQQVQQQQLVIQQQQLLIEQQPPQPQQPQPPPQYAQTGFAPRRTYENKNGLEPMMNGGSGASLPKFQAKPSRRKDRMPEIPIVQSRLSADELQKQVDASASTNKTPVSVLQEMLSRRGVTPTYELVQIEGAIHEPTFRYRVSFVDKDATHTAMGAGRSKKEAKHSAARALIEKLILTMPNLFANTNLGGLVDGGVVANTNNISGSSSGAAVNETVAGNAMGSGDSADKIVGNPIGWLQEMCMSRRWPPPNYETETEVGLPHERLFTIACTILNFREVGKGKSKKVAKRLAAHKMWNRLQETSLDGTSVNELMGGEGMDPDGQDNSNFYGDLKDIAVPTLTSQHSAKVSQFHKTLKNATGKKLIKLQKTCLRAPKLDFVKMLSDIAAENQFEVTYVDIEEKTYNNLSQCLVQLSTLPVGVCHGSGETSADAQRQAAQNALEYLKIMTKK